MIIKMKFDHWLKKKVRFIKHQDLHAYLAIGSSNFNNGVYFNIDGGGDFGDRKIPLGESFIMGN